MEVSFPFTLTKHSNVKQELNKYLYNQNTYVRSKNWSFYFLIYMKMERPCDCFGKKNYSAQIHSLADKTLCDWVITAWIAMQLWVQEVGLYAGVKWNKSNNGKDKRQWVKVTIRMKREYRRCGSPWAPSSSLGSSQNSSCHVQRF